MKIEKKKISEDVFLQIKGMIKAGTFKPGEKLPTEFELTEMFGVSRTPLREALSILEASGMIKSRQGGGNVVQSVSIVSLMEESILEMIDIDQVLHLLEVRIILESESAALAAIRRQEEDLQRIEQVLDALRQSVEAEEAVGHEQDIRFHQAIIKAAHNPVLKKTMKGIGSLYYNSVRFSLKKNVGFYEKKQQVLKEHEMIATAIKSQDSESARQAMLKHLHNARSKLEKYRDQEN